MKKPIFKKEKKFSLHEIDSIVDELKELSKTYPILTFTGPLGAGKTTLIRAFLKKSGIDQKVTSPTFGYVNIYANIHGQKFFHFDLYRIESIDQFFDQGFDEYLHMPQSISLIEWPSVIKPVLEKNVCNISLDYTDVSDCRVITIECF